MNPKVKEISARFKQALSEVGDSNIAWLIVQESLRQDEMERDFNEGPPELPPLTTGSL